MAERTAGKAARGKRKAAPATRAPKGKGKGKAAAFGSKPKDHCTKVSSCTRAVVTARRRSTISPKGTFGYSPTKSQGLSRAGDATLRVV